MINFKKGTGHSLAQSDKIGKAKLNEGVVSGMLVELNTSGETVKVATNPGSDSAWANAKLLGFAINSQTDGDVIQSGKIGFLSLDGNSVIETDQTDVEITAVNYPIGASIVTGATSGKVRVGSAANDGRIIGNVEGIRNLPGVVNGVQKNVALLGIKLKA